mgnify:FL=1
MDILEFLKNSPSPAWAAENAAHMLSAAGFTDATGKALGAGSRIYLRPHPGMLIAAHLPERH